MEFWVFGYGSLIWNPGFDATEKVLADLHGFHRSFCMASIHYRGTPEAPGLVLALDRQDGTVCSGLAYRVSAETAPTVLQYLRDRELISSAYLEMTENLHLTDGRVVQAICYVIDRDHHQYRGSLEHEQQAQIIAQAHGPAGSNRDYLHRTVESLTALQIEDQDLNWLSNRVSELSGQGA